MNRCQCLTVSGKQCSRDAVKNGQFCWQHLNCQKIVKSKVKITKKASIISKKPKTPQKPEIDQEIVYAYKDFNSDYNLGQPLSMKDFEEAYSDAKNEWLETMGEYLGEEDYDFDNQQKQIVLHNLLHMYPDKYTYEEPF